MCVYISIRHPNECFSVQFISFHFILFVGISPTQLLLVYFLSFFVPVPVSIWFCVGDSTYIHFMILKIIIRRKNQFKFNIQRIYRNRQIVRNHSCVRFDRGICRRHMVSILLSMCECVLYFFVPSLFFVWFLMCVSHDERRWYQKRKNNNKTNSGTQTLHYTLYLRDFVWIEMVRHHLNCASWKTHFRWNRF